MGGKTFGTKRWLLSPGDHTRVLKAGEKNYVRLEKGNHYRVEHPDVRGVTQKEAVEAVREGADLTIKYPDGTEIFVPDYYATCADGSCTLALGDGSALGHVLDAAAPVEWVGPVSVFAIAPQSFAAEAQPTAAAPASMPAPPAGPVSAALPSPVAKPVPPPTAMKPVLPPPKPLVAPTVAVAEESGGWGIWTWLGIGGLAAAGAAGGGGGGGEAGGENGGTDTLAPSLVGSTPTAGSDAVPVGSNVGLQFSEAVIAGNGDIVISNGSDTRVISVTDTTQVTFIGNTITINLMVNLQGNSTYNVQIASGVIKDAAGNNFAGITSGTVLNFDTETVTTTVDLSAVAAGSGGFVINGQAAGDLSGYSVSNAGDVNGDGLADLIVAGNQSDSLAFAYAGRSYVVFGKSEGTAIDLSAVAVGAGGFLINGQATHVQSRVSVSGAGDVNGDGLADLIVGAHESTDLAGAGRSYVVFGKSVGTAVDLSAIAVGVGGFVINGQAAGDSSGRSVSSAGDVNGDGLADLIVGADESDPLAGAYAGRSYVVFGKSTGMAIDLSAVVEGMGGFVINGQAASDFSGGHVSSAGDVNGDGLADLIIGAAASDPLAGAYAGRSYVVFGKSISTAVDLSAVALGAGGFVINGQSANDFSGTSVSSAGDVNGDGLADLIVGAGESDPVAGANAGRSYVVFGKSSRTAIDLSAVAAGIGGFVINGQSAGDVSGTSVSGAGDVNGDGLADLIVGASQSDPSGNAEAGRSYVVFGKSTGAAISLSAVAAGDGGFLIIGQAASDFSGVSVSSAGDVNGDGLGDLIVGALLSDPVAGESAGRSYVIFGNTTGAFAQTAVDQYGTAGADSFSDGGVSQTLVTGQGNDTLTATAASILYAGSGNDSFVINSTMITALRSAFGSGGNTNQLARIDGGTGIDALSLSGSGLTLDLTRIANQAASNPDGGSRIDSIERVNITGTGNNTLILSPADIRDMAGMNIFNSSNGWSGLGATVQRHQLVVDGNTGDVVTISGTWTQVGTASNAGQTYSVYNDSISATQLIVDSDITLNVSVDTPPVLTGSTPDDNATAVQVGSDIVLTFSETVTAGSGNIVISNGVDTRTISVTDAAQVSFSGNTVTINPTANLQGNSTYNVQMASGVIKDAAGNNFVGLSTGTAVNFDTQIVVSNIDLSAVAAGIGGFVINGQSAGDESGRSVSNAGDVNGDGLTDLIVGASDSDPVGGSDAGRSYVVYGKSDSTAIDLSAVADGNGGFVINGQAASDVSGYSVSSAGDVNGDGLADLIVGAWQSDPVAGSFAGRSYVVYGKSNSAAVDLSAVAAGSGGFVINGQSSYDHSGISVSGAGDVNGDGLADLLVGAYWSNPAAGIHAGRSYVVYGKSDSTAIDLSAVAAGTGGFVINGQAASDYSGWSVSGGGDVNGDGLGDLIIGASWSDPAGNDMAGRSYVVYGKSDSAAIDLSTVAAGSGGFVINGESSVRLSGGSVSRLGDVNGDGQADLIIGAMGGDGGRSYVVFGKGSPTAVDLSAVAAGTGGFVINGQAANFFSLTSLSGAGDVNGDGLADLLIGASWSDLVSGSEAGRTYVVYGKSNSVAVDLAAVAAGIGGFAINGQAASDASGESVSSAGDVNGDGLADLLVGAPYSDPTDGIDAGRSYVIFGNTTGAFAQTAVDQYGTTDADSYSDNGTAQTLVTGLGNDTLTATAASILYGGAGNDLFVINSTMITALRSASGSGGNINQLARIDGGTGIDTISLSGSGLTLDLTQIANQAGSNPDGGSRIDSIERINIAGTGNNTLVLSPADIRDMAGMNLFNSDNGWVGGLGTTVQRHQLVVDGNAGDVITVSGTWTNAGSVNNGGQTYNAYNHTTSATQLIVDFDITRNFVIDQAPFLIGSTPSDAATSVLVGSDIVLTFSEAVIAGYGNIVISSGTDTRTISVTDLAQISFSGDTVTINPTANLQSGSTYSVQMGSGAIKDSVGNWLVGASSSAVLHFDTQPEEVSIDLSAVAEGNNGFVINGQAASDYSGRSVSNAGDVNGDGLADLIVGASGSDPGGRSAAGRSYVVFGQSTGMGADLSAVAAGAGGFVINGQAASDGAGVSVSSAGDVNGDGYADLIVGASGSDPVVGADAGRSYVVFGKSTSSAIDLSAVASGVGGFVINGQAAGDSSGGSVSSAGDVNGDGLADLIVGAGQSDPVAGAYAGRSYVIFGKRTGTAIDLSAVAAGVDGFVINGQAADDWSGDSVSSGGDVNGDGLADLIVGASQFTGPFAGRSYVVFGKSTGTSLDLSAVAAGAGGFVINGEERGYSGSSVSNAGDVNGDGLADLIVGAYEGSQSQVSGLWAGRSYVVFGKSTGTVIELSAVAAGAGGFVIIGQSSLDYSGTSVSGAGDVNGDGLADVIVGATQPYGAGAGRSYLVFGKSTSTAIDLSAVAAGSGGFVINGQAASDFSGGSVAGAGDVNGDGLADLIVGSPTSDPIAGEDGGRSYVIFGNASGTFAQTAVDQYGTIGADSFTDSGTAQTLVTGLGNDTLTATAASILYGGAGNDVFNINATIITALQSAMGSGGNTTQLARIDGGTGIDTLSLSGISITLDLTQIANQAASNPDGGSRIDSIERIDLTGTGNNTLMLQLRDVLDMGSANTFVTTTNRQQLLVTGNTGDTLDLADGAGTTGWTQSGTASISSVTYNVWNHNTALATVYVAQSLTVI